MVYGVWVNGVWSVGEWCIEGGYLTWWQCVAGDAALAGLLSEEDARPLLSVESAIDFLEK